MNPIKTYLFDVNGLETPESDNRDGDADDRMVFITAIICGCVLAIGWLAGWIHA